MQGTDQTNYCLQCRNRQLYRASFVNGKWCRIKRKCRYCGSGETESITDNNQRIEDDMRIIRREVMQGLYSGAEVG
jgi:hypothetical protein